MTPAASRQRDQPRGPIRVVIADDSPTARHLLAGLCRSDPSLEVVGEAADGAEAVALTQRLQPDIVVMDVHMPELDGFAATRRIMQERPTPVLVVTATVGPDDVALAMRSIEAGAVAVMQKPAGPDDTHVEHGAAAFRRKVRSLAQVRVIRRYERRSPQGRPVGKPGGGARAVAVAASTGGPLALRQLLGALPAGFGAPVAVVQHIASGFLPGFAEWLATDLHLPVVIAGSGEPFAPGRVYLAPDDHHLILTGQGSLALDGTPAINGFRPSASALFSSLAAVHGSRGVGIMLTGLGSDGLTGLRVLHDAGGCVLAQDPATAIAPSMPASVVAAGIADEVAPVERLAARLQHLCTSTRSTTR